MRKRKRQSLRFSSFALLWVFFFFFFFFNDTMAVKGLITSWWTYLHNDVGTARSFSTTVRKWWGFSLPLQDAYSHVLSVATNIQQLSWLRETESDRQLSELDKTPHKTQHRSVKSGGNVSQSIKPRPKKIDAHRDREGEREWGTEDRGRDAWGGGGEREREWGRKEK